MWFFSKSVNKRLREHLTELESLGKLPDEWHWDRRRVAALRKVNAELVDDLVALHAAEKKVAVSEDAMKALRELEGDLDRMLSEAEPVSEVERAQALLANRLLTRVGELLRQELSGGELDKVIDGIWDKYGSDIGFSSGQLLYAPSAELRMSAVQRMMSKKVVEAIPLLEKVAVNDNDKFVRGEAILCLTHFNSRKSVPLIESLLDDKNPNVVSRALAALARLSPKRSINLIEGALLHQDQWVRASALDELGNAGSPRSIPLVERALKDESPYVRGYAIQTLAFLKSRGSVPLVDALLSDRDKSVRNAAKEFLSQFSIEPKHARLYIERKRPDAAFFDSQKGVVRRLFAKTGSQLLLLGGRLFGKAVVRVVSGDAFEAWKRAFEAVGVWQSEGFDYVPIEPILVKNGRLRAERMKTGEYRVFTKVLGPSFADFLARAQNKQYEERLHKEAEHISDVLEKKLKVLHGHLHDGNFCIEWHSGEPRAYAIDFDQAVSPAQSAR